MFPGPEDLDGDISGRLLFSLPHIVSEDVLARLINLAQLAFKLDYNSPISMANSDLAYISKFLWF